MTSQQEALDVLQATSRTFYIPISRLPSGLQEAVTSAYLCMRAIDQIEDHPLLDPSTKAKVLRGLSRNLQMGTEFATVDLFGQGLAAYQDQLEEVSLRIGEWALLASPSIAPRIWDATAAMAERMAQWAEHNFTIHTQADLDHYTFSVASAVGLLLSDLWAWYDHTQTDRSLAIGFGRGLQAVNIIRNRAEDLSRGVDFFPDGWAIADMIRYANYNLSLADAYTASLPTGPACEFCKIPLVLAHGTLDAISDGREKLSRQDVIALISQVTRV